MALSQARIKSAVFAALAYYAGKHTSREDLEAGSMPLEITVSGKVCKTKFRYDVHGSLLVGDDQAFASSSGPSAADLLAVMLSSPQQTVEVAIKKITARWAKDRRLPAAAEAAEKRVEDLMKSLRAAGPSRVRRGNVRFEEIPPGEAQATAKPTRRAA